jgi:ABC-type dipeptide/oligopeptide/nickel transport system permease subunit
MDVWEKEGEKQFQIVFQYLFPRAIVLIVLHRLLSLGHVVSSSWFLLDFLDLLYQTCKNISDTE